MKDATLVGWIEQCNSMNEPIEGVVIGKMGWGDFGSKLIPNYQNCPKGIVLSWEEAKPWLSYEFYEGYGAPGCQAIYVWTRSKVMFISQYDGSTNICSVPRNPTECMPSMPGG